MADIKANEMSFDQAYEIIPIYGNTLQELGSHTGKVFDASMLPYPKSRIRAAILIVLKSMTDSDGADLLEVVLMRLAQFQDGVGNEPVDWTATGPDDERWQDLVAREEEALKAQLRVEAAGIAMGPQIPIMVEAADIAMGPQIPLILCIDVEPDLREPDPRTPPSTWRGFDQFIPLFEQFRHQLARRTGAPVHFNWFVRLDPQIERVHGSASWPIRRYREAFASLEAEGDELGIHPHMFRWDEPADRWIIDHGDPTWIKRCVGQALDVFEQGLGRRARACRLGDRWLSNEVVALLERRGVVFDLSLEPGHPETPKLLAHEAATGNLPDYRMVPPFPYRPSTLDFRLPATDDPRKLWMIPVSTASLERTVRLTCNLNTHLEPLLDRNLDAEVPYLVIVGRTGRVTKKFVESLELLATHPRSASFRFVTPDEAMAMLHRDLGASTPAIDFDPRVATGDSGDIWKPFREYLKTWQRPSP